MIDRDEFYYDKYGKPISGNDWRDLFADLSYRRVGLLRHESINFTVSTVWLGLNMFFPLTSPVRSVNGADIAPVRENCPMGDIFETLVQGGPLDDHIERYKTLEEAQEGHKRLVRRTLLIEGLGLYGKV